MYSDTVSKRIEELQKREDKIFNQRDEYEQKISKVLGIEITRHQFLQLAQLFSDIERCDQGIERIQERIQDLSEAV